MTETIFFATDESGVLRRWHPDPAHLETVQAIERVEKMTIAIRGGNAVNDTATLIRFLADRLVNVHGENQNLDYIRAAHQRAAMLDGALKQPEE